MILSFIFCLNPSRLSVFQQQLRFLNKRENLSDSEMIVVWHKLSADVPNTNFKSVKQIIYDKEIYHRSGMINLAVNYCTNKTIAIVDADRILPENYYGKNCLVPDKTAISPVSMIKLLSDVSDKDIERRNFNYRSDDRTKSPTLFKKGLFSGNTILNKEDYISIGGMDENYYGYGFNDIDIHKKWLVYGYKTIWTNDEEIHLFHERLDQIDKKRYEKENELNCNYYLKKWNIPI